MLAGHCRVGDYAILSGGAAVHQFVRIGAHAFLGGLTGVGEDLIPFGMAIGNRGWLAGLNVIGMKRRGFTGDQIHRARRAYRQLFAGEGTLRERIEQVARGFRRRRGDPADRRVPARGRRPRGADAARPAGRDRVSAAAPFCLVCGAGKLPLEAAREARARRARAVPGRPRRLGRSARSRRFRISGCGSAKSASCSPR